MEQRSKKTSLEILSRLQKAKRYLENHFSEELTLDDVAKEAHLSTFHFHRLYKAYYGMNCIDYLTQIRLETSIQLLRYTQGSIADISFEVGYTNPETYIRNFKRRYGSTPALFRKSNLDWEPNPKQNPKMGNQSLSDSFFSIRDQELQHLALLRHEGSPSTLKKSFLKLVDLTIPLGSFHENTVIYGRSLDPPNLTGVQLQRYELAVPLRKGKQESLPYPLELIRIPAGRVLSAWHKKPVSELETSYDRIYNYLLYHPKLKLAHAPAWEIYHKIPPFSRKTEIELRFQLED